MQCTVCACPGHPVAVTKVTLRPRPTFHRRQPLHVLETPFALVAEGSWPICQLPNKILQSMICRTLQRACALLHARLRTAGA